MSAFGAGLGASLRHRRLAAVLWLSLFFSAFVFSHTFRKLFAPLDDGAFREALVKGWDGWGVLTFLVRHWDAIGVALAAVGGAFLLFALLTIYLTGGVLRALIGGRPRPVFRLVVSESAGLFKANLWATARYVLTGAWWIGLLVALPVRILGKIGEDAAPHTFLPDLAFWWGLAGGALVLLNVGLRYDLARVALARGEAVNARGAYRVSRRRLRGHRPSAIALAVAWLAIALAIKALFTSLGLRWGPKTNGATAALFVFRQLGFWVLAMARVGFWASLLEWENKRRDF